MDIFFDPRAAQVEFTRPNGNQRYIGTVPGNHIVGTYTEGGKKLSLESEVSSIVILVVRQWRAEIFALFSITRILLSYSDQESFAKNAKSVQALFWQKQSLWKMDKKS